MKCNTMTSSVEIIQTIEGKPLVIIDTNNSPICSWEFFKVVRAVEFRGWYRTTV